MNTNIDVLAEMEQAHATLKGLAYASELTGDHIQADVMLEARGAVAELIEAVDKHLFAIRQMDEAMNDGINVQGAVSAAIGTEEMLRAALAGVKGA